MSTITSAATASASSHLIGPLTTTYTPTGSDCNQIFWSQNLKNSWLAHGAIGSGSTTCMPSGFNRETAYYYSPGVCPTGYSAACSSYSTDSSATKTIATCCPTYSIRPNYGCASFFTEDQTLSINSALFNTVTAASTTSYPVIYASTTITVTSGVDKVAAYGVIIQRASDDPSWVSSTASSSTSSSMASPIGSGSAAVASATSSSSNVSSATDSASSSSASSSTGMSTGAKAGVAIGVALGILLIIAGTFLLFRRLRRQPRGLQPIPISELDGPTQYYEKPNSDESYNNPPYVTEAPDTTVYQRGGELHGNDISYELSGSTATGR
ncbi:uncharacterized protein EAE97_006614 [Botrytis byssoidea]|uniref:Mid2 domain-containing protein n=1 Tax=Botrytis byssoidea TaxID=139641 RepID=A0A9P5M687_9HELO|nr:uncharacterized protein EAE97_006614 [Botrytis byssoidea]KAF7941777.1 hypothetical protein EAE97_006614 [Botrytis byssoidea]